MNDFLGGKIVPKKKIPQTNQIFNNVLNTYRRAKDDPSILRISIDNKAKVKLGPYSRGGKTRDVTQVHAADYDMGGPSITPCGLFEIECAQLFITFVQGPATADTTIRRTTVSTLSLNVTGAPWSNIGMVRSLRQFKIQCSGLSR